MYGGTAAGDQEDIWYAGNVPSNGTGHGITLHAPPNNYIAASFLTYGDWQLPM